MKPKRITSVQTVPQAVWHWYEDSQTKTKVPAIGSLCCYRLFRRVRLDALSISSHAFPAMVQVDAWDDKRRCWQMVLRQDLPRPLRGQPHRINLDGLEARVLKLECLRHHPYPPGTGVCHMNPHNVPYSTLDGVEWHGTALTPWRCDLPVQLPLAVTRFRPKAGNGLRAFAEKQQVKFSSDQFAVGFSLRRPLLPHLGWDSAAGGKCADNMLFHRTLHVWGEFFDMRMISGPLWHTLDWDCGATYWGGEVSVEDNVVSYRNLRVSCSGGLRPPNVRHEQCDGSPCRIPPMADHGLPLVEDGVVVDADFEVRPDGMNVRLAQRTNSERETLECEAWRFLWNGKTSAVATLGMPRQDAGRTGATELPAIWAAPGYGNLSCRIVAGDSARLQVDSWRQHEIGWAGIVFGQPTSYPVSFQLGQARHESQFEFRVTDLAPNHPRGRKFHPEFRRNWGPALMFRPELAGFSNNSLSTNCHLSQTGVTDMAAYTAAPKVGPTPIELARHTATMALKDGRGYGDSRQIYQDSDPSILNMTGRIHQVAPHAEWLADVWPFVRRMTERILSKVDRRGLVVAPLATGNHGGVAAITNGWDCVNFGHYDAYSNAETYRAFRNVIALAGAAGDDQLRARVSHAARQMRKAFAPCFYNPKTGWLGSWRSKDGELHDYGHICVNGPACVYGLVSRSRARRILGRMEARRLELGADDFTYGLPSTLLPIRRGDYVEGAWGQGMRADGLDGFGIYCNGCLTLGSSYCYIRAMTLFGFTKVADQMAQEILKGHALDRLVGGVGSGCEFHTLDGMVCGYEGAYVPQFSALLAIAQHLGLVKTLQPEFWPDPAEFPDRLALRGGARRAWTALPIIPPISSHGTTTHLR